MKAYDMILNYWAHCSIYSKCTIVALCLLAVLLTCLTIEVYNAEKDADFDNVDPWDEGGN